MALGEQRFRKRCRFSSRPEAANKCLINNSNMQNPSYSLAVVEGATRQKVLCVSVCHPIPVSRTEALIFWRTELPPRPVGAREQCGFECYGAMRLDICAEIDFACVQFMLSQILVKNSIRNILNRSSQ